MQIFKLVLAAALAVGLSACSDQPDSSAKAKPAVASSLSVATVSAGGSCSPDGLLAHAETGGLLQCKNGAWTAAADAGKQPCDQAGDVASRDDCKFHNTMTLTKREPYKRAPVTDPLLGRGLAEPAPSSSTAK